MQITVRPACPADYEAIIDVGVRERWVSPTNRPLSYREALRRSFTLVAEVDGKFAGYARAISDGYITTFLCELLVEPYFRRMGVATRLVDAVQQAFPRTRIDLLSNADDFYRKIGFHLIGNGFRRKHPRS